MTQSWGFCGFSLATIWTPAWEVAQISRLPSYPLLPLLLVTVVRGKCHFFSALDCLRSSIRVANPFLGYPPVERTSLERDLVERTQESACTAECKYHFSVPRWAQPFQRSTRARPMTPCACVSVHGGFGSYVCVCVRLIVCHFRGGFCTSFCTFYLSILLMTAIWSAKLWTAFSRYYWGWSWLPSLVTAGLSRSGLPYGKKLKFPSKTVRNFTFFGTSLYQVAPQYEKCALMEPALLWVRWTGPCALLASAL